jgi:hypothetical protein
MDEVEEKETAPEWDNETHQLQGWYVWQIDSEYHW